MPLHFAKSNRLIALLLCTGFGLSAGTRAQACILFLPCPIPVFDAGKFGQLLLQKTTDATKGVARVAAVSKQVQKLSLHAQQIAALDRTLNLLSVSSGLSGNLETISGLNTADVYAIDDNNPYANRLFGDARLSIEEMIAATAQTHASHPALATAGINGIEFRAWFQALIKQESNFSIGARSPAAAYGLTQIIPGTAKQLGIYPAYYDDPLLQLDGGARYLLTQLQRFGSMDLALAAYNAGPGAVIKYGGIPPYRETQDYVRKVTGYYNAYAAQIGGIAQLGTLSPRDMAIAEVSNVADAGSHYAAFAATRADKSLRRLKSIVERIPTTVSAKQAMDLNTYAEVEVARIAVLLQRIKAAHLHVSAARNRLVLQAYVTDTPFIRIGN